MIRRKRENWFKMLFIWEGSVLPKILPRLLFLFILSVGVVAANGRLLTFKIPLNPAPFTLFGIALALFLGFRNNASYDRFWEGRKLWGAVLNDTRSLARQSLTLSGYEAASAEINEFINLLISYTYALKHQLRSTNADEDLKRLLPAHILEKVRGAVYKPVMLITEMGSWVQKGKGDGSIDIMAQLAFDQNLNKLSDIVGGCERIVSTPIPYTYSVLLHRTVYLYCLLLPFGFVDSLGWFTPLITVFIAYTFVALEAIADEIEEPFGIEPNDLALNEMSRMIENTLLEIAGRPLLKKNEENGFLID